MGQPSGYASEPYGLSSWWRDLWFFRLFRALWLSIDSHENGDACNIKELDGLERDLLSGGKRRRQFFRFNVEFVGREPRLDDLSKISEMKNFAQDVVHHSKQLDHLARCMIAELFLFELESVPRK